MVPVEWNAEPGIQYQLQSTFDLAPTNGTIVWSNVGPIVVGPVFRQDDTNLTAPKIFYRIKVS